MGFAARWGGRFSTHSLILAVFLSLFCILVLAHRTDCADVSYRVGPEDTISVSIARHPESSGEFFVPNDGVVNFPLVGQMKVSGKTLKDISDDLSKLLKSRLRNPEVTVSLKTPRMQRVYVIGAVEKPGLYDMKPGWRITESLAAAGGLALGTEPADCSVDILRASDGSTRTVRMSEILSGSSTDNITIESGDVLIVKADEMLSVYVMGKVKNPGLYKLQKKASGIMEVVTVAGGILDDAALDKVSVTHLSGTTETVDLTSAVLEGKKQEKTALLAGDLVVVPEETARVAVLGCVGEPGFYPLKSGKKLALADAIGLAKGVESKKGNIGSIIIIRTQDGKQEKQVYNLRKFLKTGDISQNPEIKPGDVVYVPDKGKLDWSTVLQSLTSAGIFVGSLAK